MKRLETTSFALFSLSAAIAIVVVGGCSMPKASDFKPSKLFSLGDDDDEPDKGTPVRMVGTWTDTVLSRPGQKSERGFGGRLVFYGSKEEKPILVEGQLVVYAFDENGREVTDNRPTRRYVFPPDQVALHMSKSEIGASYSFWLPWDEAGGPETDVSLICRFEPKDGAVISSEQTRHRLPGSITPTGNVAAGTPPKLPEGVPSRAPQPTLESVQASREAARGAQLANYETAVEQPRRMTTTSITLPKNFQMPANPPRTLQTPPQASPIPTNTISPNAIPAGLPQPAPATTIQRPTTQGTVAPPTSLTAPPVSQLHGAALPGQPATLRGAQPAIYTPMSSGYTAYAQQRPMMMPTAPQPVSPNNMRAVAMNSVQPGPTTLLTQQQMQIAGAPQSANQSPNQPVMIQQPASQPLPPASGITTTVTPPPQAALLR